MVISIHISCAYSIQGHMHRKGKKLKCYLVDLNEGRVETYVSIRMMYTKIPNMYTWWLETCKLKQNAVWIYIIFNGRSWFTASDMFTNVDPNYISRFKSVYLLTYFTCKHSYFHSCISFVINKGAMNTYFPQWKLLYASIRCCFRDFECQCLIGRCHWWNGSSAFPICFFSELTHFQS